VTARTERARSKAPRAVLFDLDETLLDFGLSERRALRAALAEHGLPAGPSVVEAYRRINDALWARYRRGTIRQPALARERFRRLLRGLGADPRAADALGELYLTDLSRRADLLPGCRRTLVALARRHRLAIVTNGIDRVQRGRLEASGLRRLFDVVVTSEGCGFRKPDPRILENALAALGVTPRHALYVGDDLETDGGAARAAGVPFCWVDRNRGLEGRPRPKVLWPRFRVTRLTQLLELLDPGDTTAASEHL
jgi:YjjG family noncanonical pyrimidine nucleotidase